MSDTSLLDVNAFQYLEYAPRRWTLCWFASLVGNGLVAVNQRTFRSLTEANWELTRYALIAALDAVRAPGRTGSRPLSYWRLIWPRRKPCCAIRRSPWSRSLNGLTSPPRLSTAPAGWTKRSGILMVSDGKRSPRDRTPPAFACPNSPPTSRSLLPDWLDDALTFSYLCASLTHRQPPDVLLSLC